MARASIASGMLALTKMSTLLAEFLPGVIAWLQNPGLAGAGPSIWQDGLRQGIGALMQVPAFAALMVAGLMLVLLGRRPRQQIGFQPMR